MGYAGEGIEVSIEEKIGVLSANKRSGWKKELNLVSWNGCEAKFDIREWDPDHEKMGRGVTFTETEARVLRSLLDEYFG